MSWSAPTGISLALRFDLPAMPGTGTVTCMDTRMLGLAVIILPQRVWPRIGSFWLSHPELC
jgi:hypothetical protein